MTKATRLTFSSGSSDRRDVAAGRVGVLAQLAGDQAQRPDVEDVAVARDLGLDRLRRVHRGRREHQRRAVDELGLPLVVGAEGELRLLLGRQVEAEQLLVAADTRQVDDRLAVGRNRRRVVGKRVVGEVGDVARGGVEQEDVADGVAQARERDVAPARRNRRRLGLVHGLHREALLDVGRDDVLQDQRLLFFRAHEVRELIADRRPRHPRHGVPPAAGRRDVGKPHPLVEALGEVADDRAVLGGQQHDVQLLLAPVADHRGHQVARRRRLDREHRGVLRLLGVGRQVAPVVGRTFLVAERLEAILQVLLELLVELFGLELKGLFVRVFAAADDALAQREHELPDAFLAPLRLDELEHRVPEVVDQARIAEAAVPLELAHLRHGVGHGGIAHRHQVDGPPDARHVVRQALVHPQRHAAPDQGLRDDVELEDVRELVHDEPVEQVGRLVDGQHHAVAERLGKRAHAFLGGAGNDVLLLELAAGLEEDQGNLEREVVLQIGADLLVRAFRISGHPLEMLLDLGVVVDLEVIGGVDVPPEVVVPDLVLAEIRDVGRLGHGRQGAGEQQRRRQPCETSRQAARRARAHTGLLAGSNTESRGRGRNGWHLTVSHGLKPQPRIGQDSPRSKPRTSGWLSSDGGIRGKVGRIVIETGNPLRQKRTPAPGRPRNSPPGVRLMRAR